MNPKIFIGVMSKNIVDSVIEYANDNNVCFGLIPSRRQVDFNSGYVNNWTTKTFSEYVKNKSDKILLVRDHAGPNQGLIEDDGFESFEEDCKYMDVVHVDIWKKFKNYEEGLEETVKFINKGFQINKNILYEIGTEESIRKTNPDELNRLIIDLKENLKENVFKKIKYVVIQSGTALKESKNVGYYNQERLIKMTKIAKKFKLISKEHNGDYLPINLIREKFINGLNCINIAPEFGQIETNLILEEIYKKNNTLFEEFYKICFDSKKWEKWVDAEFNPNKNKEELVKICGHYTFSYDSFKKIKSNLNNDIDEKIKEKIKNKIESLVKAINLI